MEEKRSKVLVVRSGPGRPEALAALNLAGELRAQGSAVGLVLIQDAVLCALTLSSLVAVERLRALVADGVVCDYLASDLAMRGYGPADTLRECRPLDYDSMVDVLLAEKASVAGTF